MTFGGEIEREEHRIGLRFAGRWKRCRIAKKLKGQGIVKAPQSRLEAFPRFLAEREESASGRNATTRDTVSNYQMAMRSAAVVSRSHLCRRTVVVRRSPVFPRSFSEVGKGRILSEEERAAENIYIQKMEREKLEKKKRREERDKAEKEKENADKKPEGEAHMG
ncbi:hypothetical protein Nepgr_001327 [Nepenthes gracilis]|uniref:Uncharacterized protein n=1 Tax=Nepenthes gracilis TaxID=150966 RepID=A0AAD3P4Z3_NEPGR|nr:hypothetical protein Nepgr_001327 [Nepenthes gracilis]